MWLTNELLKLTIPSCLQSTDYPVKIHPNDVLFILQ